jgi:hypothetical protein
MSVRGFQSDIVENWYQGVVTAMLSDRLPDGALSGAKNTQFYNVGPNYAVVGTRSGCTPQNTTALAAAVVSQHYLNTQTADVHLLALTNGNIVALESGTPSTLAAAVLTEPTEVGSWASFENWAYLINGTDAIKTDGTTVAKFGIAQPAVGAWTAVAASGGSNLPAGDYVLVVQYVNSATGHAGPESDPISVTIAGSQRIRVTLPSTSTIGDSQVDYTRIYLQQTGTRNGYFQVVAGTSPGISGTNGWGVAAGTTTVYIDSSQDEIDVFITLSPGVNNNYPPPVNARHIVTAHQRMFVADATNLYWSDVGDPESFNTTDNTNPIGEDGEYIQPVHPKGKSPRLRCPTTRRFQ